MIFLEIIPGGLASQTSGKTVDIAFSGFRNSRSAPAPVIFHRGSSRNHKPTPGSHCGCFRNDKPMPESHYGSIRNGKPMPESHCGNSRNHKSTPGSHCGSSRNDKSTPGCHCGSSRNEFRLLNFLNLNAGEAKHTPGEVRGLWGKDSFGGSNWDPRIAQLRSE